MLRDMSVTVSTDKSLLDVAFVHEFLANSYWSESISLEFVQQSFEQSLCFGIYEESAQIGFARVITDYCTFAYLADVFVDAECSGQGHGKTLMRYIMSYPDLQRIKRWHLVTRDAQGLYQQFGFAQVEHSDQHMEITNPNIFKHS